MSSVTSICTLGKSSNTNVYVTQLSLLLNGKDVTIKMFDLTIERICEKSILSRGKYRFRFVDRKRSQENNSL